MSKMKELLEKLTIKEEDWTSMNLVNMKTKAQSVVCLFTVLENTLAPHITPSETELIANTRNKLLTYLDEHFISVNPPKKDRN